MYKTTDYYSAPHERVLCWNDPDIAIAWPLNGDPILSAKDATGTSLADLI
jgi:dTDP-4-dehydrorhamnose 3,5-epimerase